MDGPPLQACEARQSLKIKARRARSFKCVKLEVRLGQARSSFTDRFERFVTQKQKQPRNNFVGGTFATSLQHTARQTQLG
jgi:hypothetical protein